MNMCRVVLGMAAALGMSAGVTSCQSGGSGSPTLAGTGYRAGAADGLASGVYVVPGDRDDGRWVVVLPGASGLKVFDDSTHYFKAADTIAAAGFDVIVVDYKAAYRAAADRPDVETGEKIAWVLERTVEWARREGIIKSGEPGAVVAWSLGAEGLWAVLKDEGKVAAMGLRGAAAYYPSNERETAIRAGVPLLVLAGEADDVTPAKEIRAAIGSGDGAGVRNVYYPGAMHGFDIESIAKPRKISLIPLVGPTATFGYNADAAADARQRLVEFLDEVVR